MTEQLHQFRDKHLFLIYSYSISLLSKIFIFSCSQTIMQTTHTSSKQLPRSQLVKGLAFIPGVKIKRLQSRNMNISLESSVSCFLWAHENAAVRLEEFIKRSSWRFKDPAGTRSSAAFNAVLLLMERFPPHWKRAHDTRGWASHSNTNSVMYQRWLEAAFQLLAEASWRFLSINFICVSLWGRRLRSHLFGLKDVKARFFK